MVIRNYASGLRFVSLTAENRRQTTAHSLQLTYMNFNSYFLSLQVTKRIIKKIIRPDFKQRKKNLKLAQPAPTSTSKQLNLRLL